MKNLADALDTLKQEHLFRTRNINSTAQQIDPVINGKKVLSFCSNDYLGLANHPTVLESFVASAKKFGVGSGASHLITGYHASHHALEEELAEFFGCEKALLFSTGYMANLGIISVLANRNSIVFEDRLNHASLIDAGILSRAKIKRYKHVHTQDLESKLKNTNQKHSLIVSDGVFSMDGTIAPFQELQKIAKLNNSALLIDDAHGIGVLGEDGKGTTENCLNRETLLMGTLGKALGTFGAFVVAKQEIIEWLIQQSRTYMYTTATPPAVAEATRTSLKLLQTESWRREKLTSLVTQFRQSCKQEGITLSASQTPIQPIVLGKAQQAIKTSKKLLEQGILVSAIRPPTVPKNQARLRVTFSAAHEAQHVDQLVENLVKVTQ